MAYLQAQEISMTFIDPSGKRVNALTDVSLSVAEKRFVSIIGPSGCGKSTLFNIMAGLVTPTSGSILINEQECTGKKGIVGYMLQKDLLLPWRSTLDNVILGLELRGVEKQTAYQKALPLLRRYGLAGFEHVRPNSLSGGMRQRVALIRTLLYDKDILLFDEPFGALDAQTRSVMQQWLLQVWGELEKTVLFVTHDIEEALFLSDEIYVMSQRPGRILKHIEIPLQRPRSFGLLSTPEFMNLKAQVWSLLQKETQDHE